MDAGVLIDLNRMTKKSYDAETTLATYEPGGTFGDIYEYFIRYNRTMVGARLNGVGGLDWRWAAVSATCRRSMAWRACDGFRQLEVVLPSGETVNASAAENPGPLLCVPRRWRQRLRRRHQVHGGRAGAWARLQQETSSTSLRRTTRSSRLLKTLRYTTRTPGASIIGTYERGCFFRLAGSTFSSPTPVGLSKAKYDAVQASFRDMVASVPSAKGLSLFLNDASHDQNPVEHLFAVWTPAGHQGQVRPGRMLCQVPDYTGGWSFA